MPEGVSKPKSLKSVREKQEYRRDRNSFWNKYKRTVAREQSLKMKEKRENLAKSMSKK